MGHYLAYNASMWSVTYQRLLPTDPHIDVMDQSGQGEWPKGMEEERSRGQCRGLMAG